MRISSRVDRRVARLALDASFLSLSMIFSFVEHLLPLSLLIPLPGVKLGLANVVITAVFFLLSPIDAGVISLLRIFLSALLFGSPVSLFFSLCGGAIAYLMLFLSRFSYPRAVSFVGVSVLAAAGHHVGQIFAAVLLFESGVIFSYLPVLLVAGVVTGGITGSLLNVLSPRLASMKKG